MQKALLGFQPIHRLKGAAGAGGDFASLLVRSLNWVTVSSDLRGASFHWPGVDLAEAASLSPCGGWK